jgi:SAM-dependent methyltransferase
MAGQRPPELAPAIRAGAGRLPLRDQSVDAAMAILTLHHWDEDQERGVREMRRVARGAVVILTYDAEVSGQMWLMADYLREVAELDRKIMPSIDAVNGWLGGTTRVEAVAVPDATPDWTLGSFWAHPERVLDPAPRLSAGAPVVRRRDATDNQYAVVRCRFFRPNRRRPGEMHEH